MVVLGLGAEPVRTNTDRKSVVLMGFHVGAALVAVTLWLVFAVGEAAIVGWLGLIVVAATIALGISTLLSSRVRERVGPPEASPKPVSTGILVAHGGAALLAAVAAVAAVL